MSIGRQGEQFVYNYLIDTYNSELQAGTVSIRWINDKTETGLPYDIVLEVSTDKYKPATEYFIEVKATRTRDKSFFEISHKEWCFAQMKVRPYCVINQFQLCDMYKTHSLCLFRVTTILFFVPLELQQKIPLLFGTYYNFFYFKLL